MAYFAIETTVSSCLFLTSNCVADRERGVGVWKLRFRSFNVGFSIFYLAFSAGIQIYIHRCIKISSFGIRWKLAAIRVLKFFSLKETIKLNRRC